MKLLLVAYTTRNYLGGMETYIKCLEKGLRKKGVFVESIFLDDLIDPFKWKLIKLRALIQSLGIRDRYRVFAVQKFMNYLTKSIQKKIEKFKPDLIHTQDVSSTAAIVPLVKLVNIPIIMTDHGILKPKGKRYQALMTKNQEITFKNVRAIICPAEHMRNLLNREAPWVRSFVVHHAINVDDFITSGRGENPFKTKPYILVVARFLPYKGVDIAIQAFSKIIKKYPKFHLVLAGHGPLYNELKSLTISLRLTNSVHFLLAVPRQKISFLYRDAEIVWIPSKTGEGTTEPFSIVSLEAMAFSKPIVATKEGGPAEIFRDGGAILVPPGDPDALAKATIELLKNPELAKKIGEEAGRIVKEKYDIDQWIDKMIKIYQEIIASNYE
jgi:glycosyltransferase involved in cell wall biosynthesis